MKKPTFVLISLAQRKRDLEDQVTWEAYVRDPYILRLEELGLTPLLVSPASNHETRRSLYEVASGILLTGGMDIDPKLYGAKDVHAKTKAHEGERDILELLLFDWARQGNKPVMAICRGFQLGAIASGGVLDQHLPDSGISEVHSAASAGYGEFMKRTPTKISLSPESRAAKLLGKTEIYGQCAHHQAVMSVGPWMTISGRSAEGVAEVAEANDPNFWCFLFGPHSEPNNNNDFTRAWQGFSQACYEYPRLAYSL